MTPTAAIPEKTKPQAPARGRITGLEVFSSGIKRGKQYTEDDLDAMQRNFDRYGRGQRPGFDVPAVFSHNEMTPEEREAWLKGTDTVAEAKIENVYRDNGRLKVDLGNVSPALEQALAEGRILSVSAEIYDSPQDASPEMEGAGKMLRRVAFLGGQLPEDKNLARIPPVTKHAEFRRASLRFVDCVRRTGQAFYSCFSEVSMPTRDEMIQKLAEKGMNADALKASPDQMLAEACRMADGMDTPPAPAPAMNYDDEPPEEMDPDKRKKMAAYAAKMSAKYADAPVSVTTGGGKPPDKTEPDKMSEAVKKFITDTVAATIGAVATNAETKLGKVLKMSEELEQNTRRAHIEKFVEAERVAGRVEAWELDPGDSKAPRVTLIESLLGEDNSAKVHKFSEGGTIKTGTRLEKALAEIHSRPIKVRRGPVYKDPGSAEAKIEADAEAGKVKKFAEDNADRMKRYGMTAEQMVKSFQINKKHDPEVTAEDYLAGYADETAA